MVLFHIVARSRHLPAVRSASVEPDAVDCGVEHDALGLRVSLRQWPTGAALVAGGWKGVGHGILEEEWMKRKWYVRREVCILYTKSIQIYPNL